MSGKKRTTVRLYVKAPDEFGRMVEELGTPERLNSKYLEFGEYAVLELVVTPDFRIVKGKFC